MVAVKTMIIPKDSTNKDPDLAKEFVKFVVEPKRFAEYIKGANGRWFPAFKDVAADPFFSQGQVGKSGEKDPHLPMVTKNLPRADHEGLRSLKNPANSQVYAENVWGKAMSRPSWTSGRPRRQPTRPSRASRPSSPSGASVELHPWPTACIAASPRGLISRSVTAAAGDPVAAVTQHAGAALLAAPDRPVPGLRRLSALLRGDPGSRPLHLRGAVQRPDLRANDHQHHRLRGDRGQRQALPRPAALGPSRAEAGPRGSSPRSSSCRGPSRCCRASSRCGG